ncbi:hypothetical protein LGT41_0014720 [Abyssibius alkaniclasticus]|uniref:hypothetical protein n=1 Tax=Abyssibius alkaniclasticus TaxID=2881234 RepID=UPI002363DDE6|nr:hypothetical protein [Abyssibius alkaniclasticus]UPH71019.1 hypothetical protein LGT41_0014720 [Abyssibius alkaniclasticus]|tara:strand:- start:58 stop:408 length:351 start_codon:yes stop_codon:yes gene_type:complete
MTEDEMIKRLNAAAEPSALPPALPRGLMARVLADATAAQLALNPAANIVALHPARQIWTWVSAGAMAASALLGVALGYGGTDSLLAVPGLGDIVAGYSTTTGTDSYSALTVFLSEG